MTTKPNKPHTFAEMEHVLTGAQAGDTVSIVLTLGHKPTRYQVIDEDGDTLYLQGARGSEPEIVVAAAEQTVWLTTGKRNRRVVQVSVEAPSQTRADIVERLRSDLTEANLEIVGLRSSVRALLQSKAEHEDKLTAKSYEVEECRIALGQLYNVAHGQHPGSTPLPYDVSPSAVVIDVMAAMLWHSRPPETNGHPVDAYRSAIRVALPGSMQNEKTGAHQ
jgi:hypothetical protein